LPARPAATGRNTIAAASPDSRQHASTAARTMRAAGALAHTRASERTSGRHPAPPAARAAASAASTTAGAGGESKRLRGLTAAGAMAAAVAATAAAGVHAAALRVARGARPTRDVTGG